MVEAGRHFATIKGMPVQSNDALMQLAVEAMHMDDLCSFSVEQKVLRYL
jgi:hypothetical protein